MTRATNIATLWLKASAEVVVDEVGGRERASVVDRSLHQEHEKY